MNRTPLTRKTPMKRGTTPLARTPMKRRSPTFIDAATARALYESGKSMRDVAAELGCTQSTVSRSFARAGIEARGERVEIDPDEVVRIYTTEGVGVRDVARRLGIESPRRVREILKSRGVTRPAHRPKGKRSDKIAYETEFRRMRPVIHARSGGRCEARCNAVCSGRAAHVHHRKLRSQGGGNSEADLLDVCARCHNWIHDHPAEAYERGWLVHEWDDPAQVPVGGQEGESE